MSNIRDVSSLFKIPKATAEAMKTNLEQLDSIKAVSAQLKSLGIVDDKSIKFIDDIEKLTKDMLKNFPIDDQ